MSRMGLGCAKTLPGSRADGERVSPVALTCFRSTPQVRTCPGALANIRLCANTAAPGRSLGAPRRRSMVSSAVSLMRGCCAHRFSVLTVIHGFDALCHRVGLRGKFLDLLASPIQNPGRQAQALL